VGPAHLIHPRRWYNLIPDLPAPPPRGVTDTEIRFGTVIPFSGIRKEPARQMKLGIETAFNRANEAGGVNGRKLRLIAADDGYDPARTLGPAQKIVKSLDIDRRRN